MIVKFEIYFDGEYWCAKGIDDDMFTQLDKLMENIQEAVELHFS